MDLYPSIDLLGGKCVRLERGNFERVTVYSDRPAEIASEFARQGARWIHVVDLDGARTGVQSNLDCVREIAKTAGVQLQMGGGLRTAAAIKEVLQGGVARCVVGTAALDPKLLRELGREFAEKLAVGLDVEGGTIRVAGWTRDSGIRVEELLRELREASLRYVVVTDISRDGMLTGPNILLLKQAVSEGFRVIASGGVSSLADLELLAEKLPKLEGVIVGKAIYEKIFTVKEAIERLKASGQ
ncbi:MAG TPA: 1-(5-phosphoribosyl)-5-[(5-phosphoribosylamino)methylideneamino]imidazole-4-carboxamide isomerase [Acidobacteriota bacterium]|jgi:phosphoribosylformimino-5-aminoimidazole carboxamide ribotide isomerase|nr:1-(5-phosphoribosyl)-5-[(5-phosphoribosylamino)methylideneamino]imidazole-4-carboxamide isomerase [Acidobacteriota bacterium]